MLVFRATRLLVNVFVVFLHSECLMPRFSLTVCLIVHFYLNFFCCFCLVFCFAYAGLVTYNIFLSLVFSSAFFLYTWCEALSLFYTLIGHFSLLETTRACILCNSLMPCRHGRSLHIYMRHHSVFWWLISVRHLMKCYRMTLSLLYSFISYSVWLLASEGQACTLKDSPTGFKCHCGEKAANGYARTTHLVGKAFALTCSNSITL